MPYHSRYSSHKAFFHSEVSPLIKLWLFRILIDMNAHRNFIYKKGLHNTRLAEYIGMGEYVKGEDEAYSQSSALARLRELHIASEKKDASILASFVLQENITRLSQLVTLSPTECRILEFAVLIHNERLLDDTADMLGSLSSSKAIQALSVILRLPEREVRSALGAHSALSKSGIVSLSKNDKNLRAKFEFLSDNFVDDIATAPIEPTALLKDMVSEGVEPTLQLEDFSHLDQTLKMLVPYLRNALNEKRKGVNVFIYGPPGTGKTELVRVIAKHLQKNLFEIASQSEAGEALEGEQRLRSFSAAQTFFAQGEALVLFDEVEHIFNDGSVFTGAQSTAEKRKIWMNRVLESNEVPSFWLSNKARGMDPAFVRRFDFVVELPVPSKARREAIIAKSCSGLLKPHEVSHFAESKSLSPAIIVRSASIVNSIKADIGEDSTCSALELLIGKTLKAQGHGSIRKYNVSVTSEIYDPAFINTDANLSRITEGLCQARSGRICLYGPPGTGKTAFVRWFADQLDTQLLVKRASDLISKWVGQTESNIADAFSEAEDENAVLLIDEVDSFLQERRNARSSWEVTSVNEMLTQMEGFSGVFFATTNLMSDIDQAALRRFDLKVRLDYLRPDQAWELFCRHCKTLGLEISEIDCKERILKLSNLTPGDFAVISRQHHFNQLDSADMFIKALETECSLKGGGKQSIGFF